jgi:hypothetical protein
MRNILTWMNTAFVIGKLIKILLLFCCCLTLHIIMYIFVVTNIYIVWLFVIDVEIDGTSMFLINARVHFMI